MKSIYISLLLVTLIACQPEEKSISKVWQGQPIDFSHIKQVTNTYHMFDSTDTKVGSMVFGFSFEDGMLVARDTSQFDNGSVYETAKLIFDTAGFQTEEVIIDLKTVRATLDIDLELESEKVLGSYVVNRDTTTSSFEIDSAYHFSAFREEIYMFTHALNLKNGDTVSLNALVPTSMSISKGKLIHSGSETIETLNGSELCDIIWLKTDGKMPNNKIWISKSSPRKIVKFYIPGPNLTIELISQR